MKCHYAKCEISQKEPSIETAIGAKYHTSCYIRRQNEIYGVSEEQILDELKEIKEIDL